MMDLGHGNGGDFVYWTTTSGNWGWGDGSVFVRMLGVLFVDSCTIYWLM
jgi:hypothetical protein